jgi:hypothetical protein
MGGVVSRRVTPAVAILAALLLAAAVLLVVELANGAAGGVSPAIAAPCTQRPPFTGHGLDATVQRVVLEGLDGAACRLGTTREQLVLSLSPASRGKPRWSRHRVEAAVRGGLTHAIDAEAQQGNIPTLLVPLLHGLVRSTPFEKLIQGGISLGDLLSP